MACQQKRLDGAREKQETKPVSAKNIPYDKPRTLFRLLSHGYDSYKANYDRVFSESAEITEHEWQGHKVSIDKDMPTSRVDYVSAGVRRALLINVGKP